MTSIFVSSDIWSCSKKFDLCSLLCFSRAKSVGKTCFTYLDIALGLGSTHPGPGWPKSSKWLEKQWQKFNNSSVLFPDFLPIFHGNLNMIIDLGSSHEIIAVQEQSTKGFFHFFDYKAFCPKLCIIVNFHIFSQFVLVLGQNLNLFAKVADPRTMLFWAEYFRLIFGIVDT